MRQRGVESAARVSTPEQAFRQPIPSGLVISWEPINKENCEANAVIGLGAFGGSQFIFVCWFCPYFPRGSFRQEASPLVLTESAVDVPTSLKLLLGMMESRRLLMISFKLRSWLLTPLFTPSLDFSAVIHLKSSGNPWGPIWEKEKEAVLLLGDFSLG